MVSAVALQRPVLQLQAPELILNRSAERSQRRGAPYSQWVRQRGDAGISLSAKSESEKKHLYMFISPALCQMVNVIPPISLLTVQ